MNKLFFRGFATGSVFAGAAAFLWTQQQLQEEVLTQDVRSEVGLSVSTRYQEITSLGAPGRTGVDRNLSNHLLHYSHDKRIPLWVQEHLTRDNLKGSADRAGINFQSDEGVDELWRSSNSDYKNSGWSRGHMAPAADHKSNKLSMTDSFLLSNIVPQDYNNNGDFWNRMEIYCRDLAYQFKNVWVTSGPAFIPKDKDGKKVVEYEVIGDGQVAVPTHLYKVIVVEGSEGGVRGLGAFLVPNQPIVEEEANLRQFQVSLQALEKVVGFRFYDKLDRSETTDLCQLTKCEMMSKLQLRQFVYVKQIQRAKNSEALGKLWDKVQAKQFPVTPEMQEAYEKKLRQLTKEPVVGA